MIIDDRTLLEQVRSGLARRGLDATPSDVAEVLRRDGAVVSDALVLRLVDQLRRTSVGAGALEGLLHADGVTDVLVNGAHQVFVDRGRGLEQVPSPFADEEEVRRLAVRLAASAGRRLDDASPCVDARLADGTRLHAILGVLAWPGTCISLRVPSKGGMGLDDFVANGSMDELCADLLHRLVASHAAFMVSGGTGSGKTTLLGALLEQVPTDQRILVVEDSRELNPRHPHCVRLESRIANAEGVGALGMTVLVRQALRMRPDRLVLGEVRGAELCDLLTALNTGHEGGCGTVHANSAGDLPARLEALAALGGMGREACHAQVASALQVVVHVNRWPDGRRGVSQIGVLERGSDQLVRVNEAIRWDADRRSLRGQGWERLQEVLR